MDEQINKQLSIEETAKKYDPAAMVEEEDILSDEVENEPYDVTKIKVDAQQYPLYHIMRKLSLKEINLHPDFQRHVVWDEMKQIRLIESLLVGIPMPSFYVDARDPSQWVIVDGLQRLSTFDKFVNRNGLQLRGLEFLPDLNGKTFNQLSRTHQRRIEETMLQLYLIQPDTPDDAIFAIFYRINTGGTVLSAQEIRHTLFQGPATNLLSELSQSDEFLMATTWSLPYIRMADRECILRFFAFYLMNYETYTRPNLNRFLSEAMLRINNMPNEEIEHLRNVFKKAMINARIVFGDEAFRKINPDARRRLPINKALFEVQAVTLQKFIESELESNKDAILRRFMNLMDDNEFLYSITQGTGGTWAVRHRFETFEKMIGEFLI